MTGTIDNPFSYLAGELPGCEPGARVRAGEIAATAGWLHWRAGGRLEYIGGHRGGEISRR
jgi:hypothetical protein